MTHSIKGLNTVHLYNMDSDGNESTINTTVPAGCFVITADALANFSLLMLQLVTQGYNPADKVANPVAPIRGTYAYWNVHNPNYLTLVKAGLEPGSPDFVEALKVQIADACEYIQRKNSESAAKVGKNDAAIQAENHPMNPPTLTPTLVTGSTFTIGTPGNDAKFIVKQRIEATGQFRVHFKGGIQSLVSEGQAFTVGINRVTFVKRIGNSASAWNVTIELSPTVNPPATTKKGKGKGANNSAVAAPPTAQVVPADTMADALNLLTQLLAKMQAGNNG